jgi:hypothetical protein
MAAVPAEMPVDVDDLGVEVQILLGHRAALIPSPARATQRPMEQFPRSAIRIRYPDGYRIEIIEQPTVQQTQC